MKHTKGPWDWMRDDPRDEPDGISIISREDDLTWYVAGVSGGLEGGEETREANARLIAAAPDLLDALIDILEWCEHAQKKTGIKPYGLDVAKTAIAKATGEAP